MPDNHDGPHLHTLAPPLRGRPCPSHVRCVSCSKSTRALKYVKCGMSEAPGGRICINCIDLYDIDVETKDCHKWTLNSGVNVEHNCQICHKADDMILSCACCDSALCHACACTPTVERFYSQGTYEILCNGCVPPDAYLAPDGTMERTIDEEIVPFCLLCQEFHATSREDGEIIGSYAFTCPLDKLERAPLTLLCIERRFAERANLNSHVQRNVLNGAPCSTRSTANDNRSTASSTGRYSREPIPEIETFNNIDLADDDDAVPVPNPYALPQNDPVSPETQIVNRSKAKAQPRSCPAKDMQRDNIVTQLQLRVNELEKKLDESLGHKLDRKFDQLFERLHSAQGPTEYESRCKSSQTSREDFATAQKALAKSKLPHDPLEVLAIALPNLVEKLATCLTNISDAPKCNGAPNTETKRGPRNDNGAKSTSNRRRKSRQNPPNNE